MSEKQKETIESSNYNANEIADYFVFLASQKMIDENTPEGVSPLKLQKLLYFGQAVSLALFNKKLFKEEIEAWKYGPVISSIYSRYKINPNTPIIKYGDAYKKVTDEETKKLIKGVWELFDKYSAGELVEMTHKHDPWKNTYRENENLVISSESIRDYYKNIFEITDEQEA